METTPSGIKKINGIAYFLVTFHLGWLGVHRFVRGQVGLGVIYLLTFGLFGIGLMYDVIMAGVRMCEMDDSQNIFFVDGSYRKS